MTVTPPPLFLYQSPFFYAGHGPHSLLLAGCRRPHSGRGRASSPCLRPRPPRPGLDSEGAASWGVAGRSLCQKGPGGGPRAADSTINVTETRGVCAQVVGGQGSGSRWCLLWADPGREQGPGLRGPGVRAAQAPDSLHGPWGRGSPASDESPTLSRPQVPLEAPGPLTPPPCGLPWPRSAPHPPSSRFCAPRSRPRNPAPPLPAGARSAPRVGLGRAPEWKLSSRGACFAKFLGEPPPRPAADSHGPIAASGRRWGAHTIPPPRSRPASPWQGPAPRLLALGVPAPPLAAPCGGAGHAACRLARTPVRGAGRGGAGPRPFRVRAPGRAAELPPPWPSSRWTAPTWCTAPMPSRRSTSTARRASAGRGASSRWARGAGCGPGSAGCGPGLFAR